VDELERVAYLAVIKVRLIELVDCQLDVPHDQTQRLVEIIGQAVAELGGD
jgi:hypothetical protein